MNEDAAPATLLVVDDEPSLLRLLARVLERQGYTLLTASDGIEAIDLFDQHLAAIDGVILDVVIPPNGIGEVLEHMVSARSDLAVILSSGDVPDPAVSERLRKHGGVFLRKPFLPKALLHLVESELQARNRPESTGHSEPESGV
jgi:two-component system cell cycle sensor histidine kinase/response regulator CckA